MFIVEHLELYLEALCTWNRTKSSSNNHFLDVINTWALLYYLSRSLFLSIFQSHKHYNANNIHQKYSIDFCYINKISN